MFARLTQGEKRPPALRVSPAAPTPMLVGLLRPQLILPELELSQEELEGVLSHELTHWRHRDLWIKWLAALAVCVHWFNPAARLLAERLDRDCELYCDQTVARDWDRPRRARYGELLLRLAAGGEGTPSAALFSQKQRLEERLTAMMNGKTYGKKAFVLGAAACLTLALATTALGAYTGPAVEEPLANLTEASQPETTPTVLSWPVETGGHRTALQLVYRPASTPSQGSGRNTEASTCPRPEGPRCWRRRTGRCWRRRLTRRTATMSCSGTGT